MVIVKDTQNMMNPNEFGEAIRDYAFKPDRFGGNYGCYSTFDLRDDFIRKPCPPEVVKLLCGVDENNCFYYVNEHVSIAWFWDGDGSLYVQEGSKKAINHDCKKNDEWRWTT